MCVRWGGGVPHLMCSPEGRERTKEQHVPVCLIPPYEVCCTFRLLTRRGLHRWPSLHSSHYRRGAEENVHARAQTRIV